MIPAVAHGLPPAVIRMKARRELALYRQQVRVAYPHLFADPLATAAPESPEWARKLIAEP